MSLFKTFVILCPDTQEAQCQGTPYQRSAKHEDEGEATTRVALMSEQPKIGSIVGSKTDLGSLTIIDHTRVGCWPVGPCQEWWWWKDRGVGLDCSARHASGARLKGTRRGSTTNGVESRRGRGFGNSRGRKGRGSGSDHQQCQRLGCRLCLDISKAVGGCPRQVEIIGKGDRR